MESNNEDVEQFNYIDERVEEMTEDEIEVVHVEDNEGPQVEGDETGAFEKKARSATGATSQHKKHLSSSLQKRLAAGEQNRKKQQVPSFSDSPSDGISSTTNFSYDHAKVRELASHMVLAHEYPFSIMEHGVFNKFLKAMSPFYKKINQQTVKEDCFSIYNIEKRKLKSLLEGVSRISITTDLWKSGQKIQYMVVTAHFVDSDWVLQNRVLNFCNVPPPHTGVIIADTLNKCFIDWEIENKVVSITVDNATYNDVCIKRLREDFSLRKKLSAGGKFFHIRCCAHFLNLLVQDGLGQLDDVIDVVREGVKYLKNSESRLIEFAKIKKQLQLPSKKLILDCPTRWNSTYLMLVSALEVKDVFPRYADIDPGFHYVPTEFEWLKVEEVCEFLGIFHEITKMIPGSEYPTSNIFLVELYRIKELLNEKALDLYDHIRSMVASMSAKFDKYWGESNVLLSLSAIMDPRYKMVLINHAFPVIFGEDTAPRYVAEIKDIIYELYNEYVDSHLSSQSEQKHKLVTKRKQDEVSSSSSQKTSKLAGSTVLTGKEMFHMLASEIDKTPPIKSDMDVYLEERLYACDAMENLDVLGWWKGQKLRFPILSRLAVDILSVPGTTVASESTFSAGSRIIDDRHASMSVETVQMLLCGNDWIRSLHGLKNKSHETLETAETSTSEEVELPDSFTN